MPRTRMAKGHYRALRGRLPAKWESDPLSLVDDLLKTGYLVILQFANS